MNPEVHFTNIRDVIKEKIAQANSSIRIAMAWFTDKELFDILIGKSKKGISVELILNDDSINSESDIQFEYLFANGGQVYHPNDRNRLMHNKFCVIDGNLVLNGSFNWTNKANYNSENLTVFHDTDIAEKFICEFEELKKSCSSIEHLFDTDFLHDLSIEESLNATELYERGCSRMQISNYQAAILDFTKALAIDESSATYFDLARCYFKLKDYSSTISNYTKCLELDKEERAAYFNRGLAYLRSKRYIKAYQDFDTLTTMCPNEAEYHVEKADSMVNFLDLMEYQRDKSGLGGIPSYRQMTTYEAETLMRAHHNQMDFIEYLKDIPDKSDLVIMGSMFSMRIGPSLGEKQLMQKTIEDYEVADSLGYSNKSHLYKMYAYLYGKLSDYDKALQCQKWRVNLNPESPEVYYERAEIYHKLEAYDEAISDIKRALSLTKDEKQLHTFSDAHSKYLRYKESSQKKSRGIFGWF